MHSPVTVLPVTTLCPQVIVRPDGFEGGMRLWSDAKEEEEVVEPNSKRIIPSLLALTSEQVKRVG